MREAEKREQQVRAWEARTRKEMELAQKELEAMRARSVPVSQSQSAAIRHPAAHKSVLQAANAGERDDSSQLRSQGTRLNARRTQLSYTYRRA
jgi:hypothetical protein